MDSILTSVKSSLGIAEDYTYFDQQVIMHTNSVFMILQQLGLGDKENPFTITGKTESWDDFLTALDIGSKALSLTLIQSYMYLRVRLLFDPPTNSFLVENMKQQIQEFEWRLNVAVDPL